MLPRSYGGGAVRPDIGGYGTHFIMLATCLYRTKGMGPVLELGAGWSSTLMLHNLCHGDRFLLTAESDLGWLKTFEPLVSPYHKLEHVPSWKDWDEVEKHQWSVALVDCAPGEERLDLIRRLKPRCRFIVCHDSETDYGAGGNYQYDLIFPSFKYRTDYRIVRPYTTVVSDHEQIPITPFEATYAPA